MERLGRYLWSLLIALVLVSATACGPDEEPVEEMETVETEEIAPEPAPAPEIRAMADLQAAAGQDVTGTVTFSEQPDGRVQVVARVEGVEGAGEHGFHIHETGDCSAPDFTSAGGHFAPGGNPHGSLEDAQSHAGDLGNIEIGDDGVGTLDITTGKISLGTGANSIIGKAVVLHAGRDDLTSQPSGDAGDRIACGVIALSGDDVEQGTTVDVEGEMDAGTGDTV